MQGKKTESRPESWGIYYLLELLRGFWIKEEVPLQVEETVTRPFLISNYKDSRKPKFYRPIALPNIVRKLYEQILKVRLQNTLEEIKLLSQAQAAYRKGRSTADHLLVIQELLFHFRYIKRHYCSLERAPLQLCLLDFKKHLTMCPENSFLLSYLQ